MPWSSERPFDCNVNDFASVPPLAESFSNSLWGSTSYSAHFGNQMRSPNLFRGESSALVSPLIIRCGCIWRCRGSGTRSLTSAGTDWTTAGCAAAWTSPLRAVRACPGSYSPPHSQFPANSSCLRRTLSFPTALQSMYRFHSISWAALVSLSVDHSYLFTSGCCSRLSLYHCSLLHRASVLRAESMMCLGKGCCCLRAYLCCPWSLPPNSHDLDSVSGKARKAYNRDSTCPTRCHIAFGLISVQEHGTSACRSYRRGSEACRAVSRCSALLSGKWAYWGCPAHCYFWRANIWGTNLAIASCCSCLARVSAAVAFLIFQDHLWLLWSLW